jgi:hypothetical protein
MPGPNPFGVATNATRIAGCVFEPKGFDDAVRLYEVRWRE